MNSERWERVKELFEAALPLASAARHDFLSAHCANDPDIRAEVERLLTQNDGASSCFIDRPAYEHSPLRHFGGPMFPLNAGELLAGRFRILRKVGSGGMGDVYEAEDTQLGGRLAIKTIRPEISGDPQSLARFRREITLSRQVTHSNVCRVFDLISGTRENGTPIDFLTMEFLEGDTLAAYLRSHAPMKLAEALPILEQIAQGLDAAHRARVMHRDLKSANIFLSKDAEGHLRAVVTDFGLARSTAGGDTIASGSGWAAGTPAYMAPEQLEGKTLTPSSDLYALGIIMYEMATGEAPFQGESPLQVALKRIKHKPPAPSERNPSIEPRWQSAILKCLAYEPEDRFTSGSDLIDSLRGQRTLRLPVFRARNLRWAWIAAAIIVLGATALWSVQHLRERPLPPEVARWYGEGVTALNDGAYLKATRALEQAVRLQPDLAAARCRLAEAWNELDYRDRAREELVRAIDLRPRTASDALLRDATKAFLTANWEGALAAYRQRLAAEGTIEARLDLARMLQRARRPKEAIALYREILTADASQPGAAIRLAQLLSSSGQRDEALAWLAKAEASYQVLGNTEGLAEATLLRATLESNLDRSIEIAARAEQQAVSAASAPVRLRAMLRRANALQNKGLPSEAKAVATEVVRIAQQEQLGSIAVNGLVDLGFIPFTQKRYEEAEPYFDEALQIAQRFGARLAQARVERTLAQLYFRTGRVPKAYPMIDSAQRFLEEYGDRSAVLDAMLLRGEAFQRDGRLDDARLEFEKVLKVADTPADRAVTKGLLGYLALLQRQYSVAARMFADAAAFYREAGNRVQQHYMELQQAHQLALIGQFDEAAAILDGIRKTNPENEGVRQTLALEQTTVDFQRGNYEAALHLLEELERQAAKDQKQALLANVRLQLCGKAAEAARWSQAEQACAAVIDAQAKSPNLIVVKYSMAEIAMGKGQWSRAVALAREAVELAARYKIAADEYYSLLILAQAEHGAHDPQWKATRTKAGEALTVLARSEDIDGYRKRIPIRRHMQLVEALQ